MVDYEYVGLARDAGGKLGDLKHAVEDELREHELVAAIDATSRAPLDVHHVVGIGIFQPASPGRGQGLGFRFRVSGSGSRVQGLGFRVWGSGWFRD